MENVKNNTEIQARFEERLLMGLATAIVAAFAVVVLGCAAIPAVVAYLFGWQWLMIYPGIFAACIFGVGCRKH